MKCKTGLSAVWGVIFLQLEISDMASQIYSKQIGSAPMIQRGVCSLTFEELIKK